MSMYKTNNTQTCCLHVVHNILPRSVVLSTHTSHATLMYTVTESRIESSYTVSGLSHCLMSSYRYGNDCQWFQALPIICFNGSFGLGRTLTTNDSLGFAFNSLKNFHLLGVIPAMRLALFTSSVFRTFRNSFLNI